MYFDVFAYTNQGGRSCNEDSVGWQQTDGHGIFLVADGLGGHQFGELASSCVRDTLLSGWKPEEGNRPAWLKTQIAAANTRVLELQQEKNAVLKSTIVALAIDGSKAVWANVGDSRLYYLHRGRIYSITEDHSVAYKKYKAGEITREQIPQDEDQSLLLRAIGSDKRNQPDIHICDVELEPGDGFLLCSDGVWEYLLDEEIPIDHLKADNAQKWGELLLLRMRDRIEDGNDNLTLITLILG